MAFQFQTHGNALSPAALGVLETVIADGTGCRHCAVTVLADA